MGLRFCLLKVLDGGGGGGGDTDGDTDGDADADADLNNFFGDTKEATCFDLSLQKKGAGHLVQVRQDLQLLALCPFSPNGLPFIPLQWFFFR